MPSSSPGKSARLFHVGLAQRMGSSQSCVAKAGDPSVTIDLMVRAILATLRELQRVSTAREKMAALLS